MSNRLLAAGMTTLLLVIVGGMTLMAFSFNEEARRVPLVVGIPTVVLILVQLVRDLVGSGSTSQSDDSDKDDRLRPSARDDAAASDAGAASADGERTLEDTDPVMKASVPVAFGWVGILAIMFLFFGLFATVPIFIATFMRIYGHERWRNIVVVAGGTFAAFYGFFVMLLEIRLYQGLVASWIGL